MGFVNFKVRLLSLVLSSSNCKVVQCNCPVVPIYWYHPPLEIYLKISYSVDKTDYVESHSHNFQLSDLISLYQDLALIDWSNLYLTVDINWACDCFYRLLYRVFDDWVPKILLYINKYPPLFNSNIKKLIREKSMYWHKFKKHGCV